MYIDWSDNKFMKKTLCNNTSYCADMLITNDMYEMEETV